MKWKVIVGGVFAIVGLSMLSVQRPHQDLEIEERGQSPREPNLQSGDGIPPDAQARRLLSEAEALSTELGLKISDSLAELDKSKNSLELSSRLAARDLDLLDQMATLDRDFDQGVIDQEVYMTKRSELLDRLLSET